ncbi:DUF4350 domain-containing protein [Myxococcota bacterium]|nr:DUF4350 domain-containing protein [Myxococcota bacterium]MBU1413601.1 DUF4350 domain-containing protein [Myxococcota bacterium]MBU1510340.1 DUF4350 domain-containing protein [Myxococcota bacterium]
MLPLLLSLWCLTSDAADYSPRNTEWNGFSQLWELAGEHRIPIVTSSELDWSKLDPALHTLMFWSPQTWVPPGKLWAFLHQGGRVIVAEDFRNGANLFVDMGLILIPEKARFPRAVAMVDNHPLTAGMTRLVTNHPASFVPVQTPLWAFPDSARALVLEVSVGPGRLLLVSDPSLLINDMLPRGDNRAFALRLMQWASAQGRRVYLLTDFSERNWPRWVDDENWDRQTTQQKVREMIDSVRDALARHQTGTRVLAILLLGPFIYLVLWFSTQGTHILSRKPPTLSTSTEMSRLWLRMLALTELLSRRLKTPSPVYSLPARQIRALAQEHLPDDPMLRERFIHMMSGLERSGLQQGTPRHVDHSQLLEWIDVAEEILRAFDERDERAPSGAFEPTDME